MVALFRRPLGFGEIVLPREVVATHVTSPPDDAVFVSTDDESGLADFATGRNEVEQLTRPQYVARVSSRVLGRPLSATPRDRRKSHAGN